MAVAEVYHEVVYFSGRVQGVGFRYTTLQTAREYEVAGLVRNLPDGRVELEAEGREGEVRDFIAAVEERMRGYHCKVERQSRRRLPQFSDFVLK
jgi:acylphosphatase